MGTRKIIDMAKKSTENRERKLAKLAKKQGRINGESTNKAK